MADEGQVIRGINWRLTFPFVNIFRSFRVAIHPSKLFLGLALLLVVYFGGWILDSIWPVRDRALPNEVDTYQLITTGKFSAETDALHATAPEHPAANLTEWRDEQLKAIDESYAEQLLKYGVVVPAKKDDDKAEADARKQAQDDAHDRRHVSDVLKKVTDELDQDVKEIEKAHKDAYDAADKEFKDSKESDSVKNKTLKDEKLAADKAQDAAKAAAYKTRGEEYRDVKSVEGVGLFDAFFGYEINQITGVVQSVKHGNWLSTGYSAGMVEPSVVERIENFLAIGPVWLMSQHIVFAILFGLLFLFAWSVFGGAISRIAAVHVARDEKISVRQAMNFAVGKFLSFFSAPVIPMLIVIFIGLLVALVSVVVGNIPFAGPILIGLFFFLALLAGFVMTLVLLGTAGGFNLMYATVAVEGSDSFDAISRSFSYVYARPWRMLFYTAVAIAYGAATYIFVHMFIWLMLVLTHSFVGMGIMTHAANAQELLSVMWPSPRLAGRLTYSIDYLPLTSGQATGAWLIHLWVMLLVSFLGAFAISLYFSTNTIIYYLMRSEVDATEMDDVYLEQSDEDFGETAPVTTPAGAASAPATPAPDSPPSGAQPSA